MRRRISRVPTAKELVSSPDKTEATGYAQVAQFIATDKELAVYRRFDRSAARVLLVLQSEILSKQEQLDKLDAEEANDPDEKGFLSSATIYGEMQEPPAGRDEDKNRLLGELRKLVKEYCEYSVDTSGDLSFN